MSRRTIASGVAIAAGLGDLEPQPLHDRATTRHAGERIDRRGPLELATLEVDRPPRAEQLLDRGRAAPGRGAPTPVGHRDRARPRSRRPPERCIAISSPPIAPRVRTAPSSDPQVGERNAEQVLGAHADRARVEPQQVAGGAVPLAQREACRRTGALHPRAWAASSGSRSSLRDRFNGRRIEAGKRRQERGRPQRRRWPMTDSNEPSRSASNPIAPAIRSAADPATRMPGPR